MSLTWPINTIKPGVANLETLSTLVIALRNEEDNLPSLISSIKGIFCDQMEVILVDDHSEDQTFLKLKQYYSSFVNVHVVSSSGVGKKAAIQYGIKLAKGEVILTTDADCVWEENWVDTLISPFENPQIQLVAGPVISQGQRGFLSGFQSLEWVSTLLVTNFSFVQKKPLTCSAANMAFRKSAFIQVEGFEGNEDNPSGDDEFLLKKVVAFYGVDAVNYLPSKESLVQTRPESSWEDLIQQKIRWAGKWKSHSSLFHSLGAIVPALYQVIWLSSLVFLFNGGLNLLVFCSIWIFKILAETIAFERILRSLGKPFYLPLLIGTSFIHPFYVTLVVLGVIRGKYHWKGRVTKRSD